jgi:GNAT superfamily N-acetyltransferase
MRPCHIDAAAGLGLRTTARHGGLGIVSSPSARIRVASLTDLPRLQVIQLAAGAAFRDIGMAEIADNPATPIDDLRGYQQARHAWVAIDDLDQPIAFVLVDLVDEYAHIEQVSVHPDHARHGLGRILIDHVGAWASARGLRALTLMTFRDVPWNAPYYQRLGFEEFPEGLTSGLAALMAAEIASGLDPATRVCMRRDIE